MWNPSLPEARYGTSDFCCCDPRTGSPGFCYATHALPRISEVAPAGEPLIGFGSCQLVERDPLRAGVDELSTRPVRDLEP